LQCREWQGAATHVCFWTIRRSGTPGEDFAIEHQGFSTVVKDRQQFWKRFAYVVLCARKDADSTIAAVHLGTDAVVFVLDLRVRKVGGRLLARLYLCGQHETHGMKEPHLRLLEAIFGRQAKRLTDVAEQHVCSAHRQLRLFVRGRNGLFD